MTRDTPTDILALSLSDHPETKRMADLLAGALKPLPTYQPETCQFRLSASPVDAVPSSDVTNHLIFCHPFQGNRAAVWRPGGWAVRSVKNVLSLEIPDDANYVFDIFLMFDLAEGLALRYQSWGTATARAIDLENIDGIPVDSERNNWRHIGMVGTNADGIVEDAEDARLVVNRYNRRGRSLRSVATGAQIWDYTTAVWRSLNNASLLSADFLTLGEDALMVSAAMLLAGQGGAATGYRMGVGLDDVAGVESATTGDAIEDVYKTLLWAGVLAPAAGKHTVTVNEYGGTNTRAAISPATGPLEAVLWA